MKTIAIYGHSDDCIEVEGPKGLQDEYNGENCLLVLYPTEDRFRVHYGADDRTVWKVTHEHNTGKLRTSMVEAPAGDDPDPYTDKMTVTGDIIRIECWEEWPPTTREIRKKVERKLEDRLSDDEIRRIWAALQV